MWKINIFGHFWYNFCNFTAALHPLEVWHHHNRSLPIVNLWTWSCAPLLSSYSFSLSTVFCQQGLQPEFKIWMSQCLDKDSLSLVVFLFLPSVNFQSGWAFVLKNKRVSSRMWMFACHKSLLSSTTCSAFMLIALHYLRKSNPQTPKSWMDFGLYMLHNICGTQCTLDWHTI